MADQLVTRIVVDASDSQKIRDHIALMHQAAAVGTQLGQSSTTAAGTATAAWQKTSADVATATGAMATSVSRSAESAASAVERAAQKAADAQAREAAKAARAEEAAALATARAWERTYDRVQFAVGAGFATAGASIAAGLLAAGNAAADFEQRMSAVKAVLSPEEILASGSALSSLALQLGKSGLGFSASEAATGLEAMAKAGISVTDMAAGAPGVLQLAAAGGIKVGEAAEFAANTLSVFGLRGEDMVRIANLMAGAANATTADVNDLRLAMQQFGAVANLTGQTVESATTEIALMAEAGIRGSDAGTSLKTMFLNLQPSTQKQADEMRRLNLITAEGTNRFIDATGAFKQGDEIARILNETYANMTKAQRAASLEIVFGTDAIRAATVMTSAGAEGWARLTGEIGKVTAQQVASERLNNLRGDLTNLGNAANATAIEFAQHLEPSMRPVIQQAASMVAALGAIPPKTQETIGVVAGLTAATLGVTGAFLTASAAGTAFTAMTGVALGSVLAMAAPIVAVGAALAVLAAAWINDWGDIREHTAEAAGAISPILQSVRDDLALTGNYLTLVVAPNMQSGTDALKTAIAQGLQGLGTTIRTTMEQEIPGGGILAALAGPAAQVAATEAGKQTGVAFTVGLKTQLSLVPVLGLIAPVVAAWAAQKPEMERAVGAALMPDMAQMYAIYQQDLAEQAQGVLDSLTASVIAGLDAGATETAAAARRLWDQLKGEGLSDEDIAAVWSNRLEQLLANIRAYRPEFYRVGAGAAEAIANGIGDQQGAVAAAMARILAEAKGNISEAIKEAAAAGNQLATEGLLKQQTTIQFISQATKDLTADRRAEILVMEQQKGATATLQHLLDSEVITRQQYDAVLTGVIPKQEKVLTLSQEQAKAHREHKAALTELLESTNAASVAQGLYGQVLEHTVTQAVSKSSIEVRANVQALLNQGDTFNAVRAAAAAAGVSFQTFTGAINGGVRELAQLQDSLKNAHDQILKYGAVTNQAARVGIDLMAGVTDGITQSTPKAREAMRSAATSIVQSGAEAVGAHSPSTLAAEQIGAPIAEGIAEGVEQAMPATERRMNEAIQHTVQTVGQATQQQIQSLIEQTGKAVPVYGLSASDAARQQAVANWMYGGQQGPVPGTTTPGAISGAGYLPYIGLPTQITGYRPLTLAEAMQQLSTTMQFGVNTAGGNNYTNLGGQTLAQALAGSGGRPQFPTGGFTGLGADDMSALADALLGAIGVRGGSSGSLASVSGASGGGVLTAMGESGFAMMRTAMDSAMAHMAESMGNYAIRAASAFDPNFAWSASPSWSPAERGRGGGYYTGFQMDATASRRLGIDPNALYDKLQNQQASSLLQSLLSKAPLGLQAQYGAMAAGGDVLGTLQAFWTGGGGTLDTLDQLLNNQQGPASYQMSPAQLHAGMLGGGAGGGGGQGASGTSGTGFAQAPLRAASGFGMIDPGVLVRVNDTAQEAAQSTAAMAAEAHALANNVSLAQLSWSSIADISHQAAGSIAAIPQAFSAIPLDLNSKLLSSITGAWTQATLGGPSGPIATGPGSGTFTASGNTYGGQAFSALQALAAQVAAEHPDLSADAQAGILQQQMRTNAAYIAVVGQTTETTDDLKRRQAELTDRVYALQSAADQLGSSYAAGIGVMDQLNAAQAELAGVVAQAAGSVSASSLAGPNPGYIDPLSQGQPVPTKPPEGAGSGHWVVGANGQGWAWLPDPVGGGTMPGAITGGIGSNNVPAPPSSTPPLTTTPATGGPVRIATVGGMDVYRMPDGSQVRVPAGSPPPGSPPVPVSTGIYPFGQPPGGIDATTFGKLQQGAQSGITVPAYVPGTAGPDWGVAQGNAGGPLMPAGGDTVTNHVTIPIMIDARGQGGDVIDAGVLVKRIQEEFRRQGIKLGPS